jgi:uncharacterized repeat protein (TIGR03803 family)
MQKLKFGKIACIVAVFCVVAAVASSAQTLTTIANVGGLPYGGPLIQGRNGNFFGTTSSAGRYGYGGVFEVTPSGTLTEVYSFCQEAFVCPDGQTPYAGVIQAANGNIYGTTNFGGADNGGTVFEITPGKLTTLYSFPNEQNPGGVLVQGVNGDIYGGAGKTTFSINSAGTLTTIYTFCSLPNCPDGSGSGTLVVGPGGNLYGTNGSGGAHGFGTFFKLTPAGALTTLFNFRKAEGRGGNGLVWASDGNFYGTSPAYGANNAGTVFQLTPTGRLTVLHNFCSEADCADGEEPSSALVQGTDGNLYGTTPLGGTGGTGDCVSHCGTAFQITTSGTLTTLYNFCSLADCADGLAPYYGLVQGTDGNFYGATYSGTVYSLAVGLGPFVKSNPTFGRAGYVVSILGSDLTGATSVTFNGVPATFEFVSGTLIKATVPSGATTGTIEVTTPSGVLSSNVAFRVEG